MPIYAFQCSQCGHAFDRLQRLSDPDPDTCPACAAHAVQRQLTAPYFRLVGSGWYETDFKSEGEKKHNLAETAPAAGHTDTPKPDAIGTAASKPEATGAATGSTPAPTIAASD